MDVFNLVICILNILGGLFTFIGGILWMVADANVVSVVLGIYLLCVFFFLLLPLFHFRCPIITFQNTHRIFGLYIMVVEIFMPPKLQVWMAFYLTWTGKALFFIFLGVFFIIPTKMTKGYDGFFIFTVVYLLILAVALIVLQILSCTSVTARKTARPIIIKTTTTSGSLSETLV